jgi:hypothetical protein
LRLGGEVEFVMNERKKGGGPRKGDRKQDKKKGSYWGLILVHL